MFASRGIYALGQCHRRFVAARPRCKVFFWAMVARLCRVKETPSNHDKW